MNNRLFSDMKCSFIALALFATAGSAAAQFVHPGVIHTQADLDRIRTKVTANEEPWATGYAAFNKDSRSKSTYSQKTPKTTITRSPIGSPNLSQWEDECGAAYQNAIQWVITGDTAHAAKARQILVGWASTCTEIIGSDARLTAGLQGHKFITAAEILRFARVNGATYSGWTAADTSTVSDFVRNVILPLNRMHGGGNWGIIGAISQMAAGIFLDDEGEYQEGLGVLKFGAPTEADAGIPNYVTPGGWTTEADRDIGHWALGINNLTTGAHIAWCQGDDLWTFLGNRLLVGQEYINQYNAGGSVPYTAGVQADGFPNGNLTIIGRGRWDISYQEQAWYPYRHYFGIPAPETESAVTSTRAFFAGNATYTAPDGTSYSGWYDDGIAAERYDRDHVAFGTLLFALPPRNDALPQVPGEVAATWGDAQVTITWNAAPGATSYRVKRAGSRGGPFVTIPVGVTTTSYTDTSVNNGETYYYCVVALNASGLSSESGKVRTHPSDLPPPAPSEVMASQTSHNRIDLSWTAVPGATGYEIKRAISDSGPFVTIASGVGATFPRFAVTGLSPETTYDFTVSATNSIGTGAESTVVHATTLPALPSEWSYDDAGYQTTPGNAVFDSLDGVFTVRAAGLDYGGYGADAFGMAYRSMTGDGEVIARIASRQNYSHLSKIGITLRESTAGGSKHAFMTLDGSNDSTFRYRTSTGANGSTSGSTVVATGGPPQWLKLSRVGNVFTGSVSSDGVAWVESHSVTLSMNTTLLAGLAVCSRNNGVLDTVVFDHVSVTGWTPPLPGMAVYESEDGSHATYGGGCTLDSNNAGFNGTGYINFPTSGGFLQFSGVEGNGGTATLRIRYALQQNQRTGVLIVNGVSQPITFVATGAWTTFLTSDVIVPLAPGTDNSIRFESNGQDLANIDEIAVYLSPEAPANPSAVAGDGQVLVSWNHSDRAAGYVVRRSTVPGSQGETVATLPETAFSDMDVVNGTTYYYSVAAANESGESAPAAEVDARPSAPVTAEEVASIRIERDAIGCDVFMQSSVGGHVYQLQTSDDLAEDSWQDVGDPQTSVGTPVHFPVVIDAGAPKRFFRVVIRP